MFYLIFHDSNRRLNQPKNRKRHNLSELLKLKAKMHQPEYEKCGKLSVLEIGKTRD